MSGRLSGGKEYLKVWEDVGEGDEGDGVADRHWSRARHGDCDDNGDL